VLSLVHADNSRMVTDFKYAYMLLRVTILSNQHVPVVARAAADGKL
jgi:hypothetical protein